MPSNNGTVIEIIEGAPLRAAANLEKLGAEHVPDVRRLHEILNSAERVDVYVLLDSLHFEPGTASNLDRLTVSGSAAYCKHPNPVDEPLARVLIGEDGITVEVDTADLALIPTGEIQGHGDVTVSKLRVVR